MNKITILNKGVHDHVEGGLEIDSTVTLIRGEKNIIVDTGWFYTDKKIIDSLKELNLTPDDIDIVVLTHTHIDHTLNTYLFDKALIYAKFAPKYFGQYHDPQNNILCRADVEDGTKLMKGVEILLTPGHTGDSISVVVDTEQGKIVIAGDAIAEKSLVDLDKKPVEMLVYSVEEYEKSRKKILEIADYIVPGHGDIFKNETK